MMCYILQALSCLLYEIIALKPAFDANNLISLFYKIVKGEFEVSKCFYMLLFNVCFKTLFN